MQTKFTEGRRPGEFIRSEGNDRISRDVLIIESGQGVLDPGTVLARRDVGNVVAVTSGANTGDGTVGAITTGMAVEVGTYQLVATSATKFDLFTPAGDKLKTVTVGQAFGSTHINLTVTAGAAPFAAGDSFGLAVAAGTGKYVALDTAADDGGQVAVAILYAEVDATAADVKAVGITRLAEVDADRLVWPAGISAPQMAAATASLARTFIIVR